MKSNDAYTFGSLMAGMGIVIYIVAMAIINVYPAPTFTGNLDDLDAYASDMQSYAATVEKAGYFKDAGFLLFALSVIALLGSLKADRSDAAAKNGS